jgi:hypothetical protein
MASSLRPGIRVRVKDSLLYTGRVGTLLPAGAPSEAGYAWDYHVLLEATEVPEGTSRISAKLYEERTIGVYSSQVEPA